MAALEKGHGKFRHLPGVIEFAAEHIQVNRIVRIGKMTGNQGGFDQLGHAEPFHPLVFAEMDHLAVAEPFHVDTVTQLMHELSDFFRVPDDVRITVIDIYGRQDSPGMFMFKLLFL